MSEASVMERPTQSAESEEDFCKITIGEASVHPISADTPLEIIPISSREPTISSELLSETSFPISIKLLDTFEIPPPHCEEPGESADIRANLPDFRLSNLRGGLSQPFRTGADIPFLVTAGNYGTAPANNIRMAVGISLDPDKTSWLGYTDLGSLGAGIGMNIQVTINNPNAGYYYVKMIINPNQEIPEVAYDSNNEVEALFKWAAASGGDICAYHMHIDSRIFPCMQVTPAYIEIGNLGNAPFTNVEYMFGTINLATGAKSLRTEICPRVDPQTSVRFNLGIEIRLAGNYNFYFEVDPNGRQTADSDRSDNKMTAQFEVTYDIHVWPPAWHWDDGRSLKVLIHREVLDYLEQYNLLTTSELAQCIMNWNGIYESKVHIDEVGITDSMPREVDHPSYKGYIRMFTYLPNDDPDNADAYAVTKSNSANLFSPTVGLNTVSFKTQAKQWQAKTVTHEIGHALGLDHPYPPREPEKGCNNRAVMGTIERPESNNSTITDHDRYNLVQRYINR